MKLRKSILPRNLHDFVLFTFIVCILPIFYWFEVFLVLPSMHPVYSIWYIIHTAIGTFILINITGNFVFMVLADTSIRGEFMPSTPLSSRWKYCVICETVTPPRSWHCSICNVCILKRDHHCQFGGCCIGHQNHRYFIYFLTYLTIGCIYALYFNTFFIYKFFKFSYLNVLKFIFPLAVMTLGLDFSVEHCYTLFYVINLLGTFSALFFLYYHGSSAIRGLIMYEKSHKIYDYDSGSIKENMLQILGDKWYLTWILPFINSKLPGDGINWVKCSPKVK